MPSNTLLDALADRIRAIASTSDSPILEATQQEIRDLAIGSEEVLTAADFSPGEGDGPTHPGTAQPAFSAEFVAGGGSVADPVESAVLGIEAIRSKKELALEPTLYATAIVLRTERPAVDVVNDTFTTPPAPWAGLADHRDVLSPRLGGIGRIRSESAPYGRVAGTGFLVGPGLLLTNRHVANFFSQGVGTQDLTFVVEEDASCDLAAERGHTREVPLSIEGPVLLHPYWDVAVVRVSGAALTASSPLRLRATAPDEVIGREAAVVGYPVEQYLGKKEMRELRASIFGSIYGIKRLLPGKLLARQAIPTLLPTAGAGGPSRLVQALGHDASTLAGNSGSAVLDPATGDVLAVHFKGYTLKANYAVPAWELARDPHLRDLDGNGLSLCFTEGPVEDPDPEVEAAWSEA